MSRKKISEISFKNGATFKTYLHKHSPRNRKGANDYIEVQLTPEEGISERSGWMMNGYDIINLIWLLSNSLLVLQEEGRSLLPESMIKQH